MICPLMDFIVEILHHLQVVGGVGVDKTDEITRKNETLRYGLTAINHAFHFNFSSFPNFNQCHKCRETENC